MDATSVGSVTFRVGARDPTAVECSAASCEVSAALSDPGVATGIIVLAVAALVTFMYISEARPQVREERRRIVDERDAFNEFIDRTRGLTPHKADEFSATGGTGGTVRLTRFETRAPLPPDNLRDRVCSDYRETVMSVPHYTEEYDDSLAESLREELGTDVTTALLTEERVSSPLHATIVARSQGARAARGELLDAVDAELAELDDVETRLTRIDRTRTALRSHLEDGNADPTFEACQDVWRTLGDLEETCGSLSSDRQETLRDPPYAPADDQPSFHEYLYADSDGTDHPVLSAIAELTDRIRTDRRHVLRRLTKTG